MHTKTRWTAAVIVIVVVLGLLALAVFPKKSVAPTENGAGGAPVVGVGEHCGGFMRNAPVCASGFHCQLTAGRPDTGGTCQSDAATSTANQ